MQHTSFLINSVLYTKSTCLPFTNLPTWIFRFIHLIQDSMSRFLISKAPPFNLHVYYQQGYSWVYATWCMFKRRGLGQAGQNIHRPDATNHRKHLLCMQLKQKLDWIIRKKNSNTYVKTRVCKFPILNQTISI